MNRTAFLDDKSHIHVIFTLLSLLINAHWRIVSWSTQSCLRGNSFLYEPRVFISWFARKDRLALCVFGEEQDFFKPIVSSLTWEFSCWLCWIQVMSGIEVSCVDRGLKESKCELECVAVSAQRNLSKNLMYCMRKKEETICPRKHLCVFIMSIFYHTSAGLVLSVSFFLQII